MGTGTLEQALVNNLCKNYCQQDHLKVRIVMDGNRGTRVERSTVVLDEDPPPTATTATTAATTAATAVRLCRFVAVPFRCGFGFAEKVAHAFGDVAKIFVDGHRRLHK
jgi:hypothetical protein